MTAQTIKTILTTIACALLLTVGASSASWAATYYVSTTGSDSNNGTATTTPFRTIQKSLNVVRAGDTVNIMAGTYNEGLALMTSGTSSARITVQNYNGASVTINSGTSRAVRLNAVLGYYTLHGLTFVSTYVGNYVGSSDYSVDLGTGGPGWWGYGFPNDSAQGVNDDSNGNNGFIVENCNITGNIGIQGHNNIVRYCTLNGNNQYKNGIHDFTVVSHNNTYTHNTISRYTDRGIWSMSNTYNITVTYNDISHWGASSNPAAVDFDGAWLPVYNSTIAYNTLHDGDGTNSLGMQFENGMNCVCNANLIYNVVQGMTAINYQKTTAGGYYGYGYYNFQTYNSSNLVMGGVPYSSGNTFMNNIVYNTSSAGILLDMSFGNFLYNNTFDNCKGTYGAIVLANGGTSVGCQNTTISNNIISNSSYGVMVEAGSTIASQTNNLFYNNTNNGTTGAAIQSGNPAYTNQSGHVYTLTGSSAAIGKGTTISAVTTDFAGATRPQGGAYDIGAYEYNTVVTTAAPLSAPTGLTVQ